MIKVNRKIVHSFAQILRVVILFMALLIVPATAQPQQHKIIFVLVLALIHMWI
jgi:hypothetical protein